ncbi:MAG: glycosyltransferase family 4 protein [Candidatus Omnitrophota bacterium]
MIGKAVRVLDYAAGVVFSVIFICAVTPLAFVSMLIPRKRQPPREISELYISIIDFRQSVLSTYKDDILLDGFIRKAYCYHFDFDKERDERVNINEFITLHNVSVHPDNIWVRMGLRKTSACVIELITLMRMLMTAVFRKVNVIRAHDPHLLGFNAFVISKITGIPFIVQICSNYELKDRGAKGITFRPFLFKPVERCFERFIMKSADKVITDREHYRAFGLIPREIPDTRYANIGFFVDKTHYDLPETALDMRADLGIEDGRKILLYVGRLSEVKYAMDLINILEICLKRRKDILLLISGEGGLKTDMAGQAGERGIAGNVRFLDYLPQEKVRRLYRTADVMCFTSAGFTMIEAALAEACIVAYDFEWHGEFTGLNERGMLVPFGDCALFARTVLDLLDDSDARRRLGKAARSFALARYRREDSIKKEVRVYMDMLGTGRG